MPEIDGKHHCDVPVDKTGLAYGWPWVCPECKSRWTLTVDETGECGAYWDIEI